MRRVLLVALAAGLAGCFNPEIGDRPFLCAKTGDKKCPDGYVCRQQYGAEVCLKESAASDGAVTPKPEKRILTDAELLPSKEGPAYLDGAVVQSSKGCFDESSEPNNTSATATRITGQGLIPDWEICYAGDVDHYWFDLNAEDKLVVKIIFFTKNGDLDAALLDPDGFVVDTSRGTADNEQVQYKADKKGKYVVGVYGFGPAVNKYNLDVSITQ
jgi:hypothetical protein